MRWLPLILLTIIVLGCAQQDDLERPESSLITGTFVYNGFSYVFGDLYEYDGLLAIDYTVRNEQTYLRQHKKLLSVVLIDGSGIRTEPLPLNEVEQLELPGVIRHYKDLEDDEFDEGTYYFAYEGTSEGFALEVQPIAAAVKQTIPLETSFETFSDCALPEDSIVSGDSGAFQIALTDLYVVDSGERGQVSRAVIYVHKDQNFKTWDKYEIEMSITTVEGADRVERVVSVEDLAPDDSCFEEDIIELPMSITRLTSLQTIRLALIEEGTAVVTGSATLDLKEFS